MNKYIITTTNPDGDANSPIILEAKDIEDAVNKFERYVFEEIKEAFQDTFKNIDFKEVPDIHHLASVLGSHSIKMDTTSIRVKRKNDNGDLWTEWCVYSTEFLNTIS